MKRFKPTTPGQRGKVAISYRGLVSANNPHKSLTRGRGKKAGRNSYGRITTRHQGGGHKRRFRDIDFKFDKKDVPFKLVSVEYDPFRTGFIGLVNYADGEKRYILVPKGMVVGTEGIVSENAPIKAGNRAVLKNIPLGSFVYNIEIKVNSGAKLVRSAGTYAEILARDGGYVDLKMPSSEVRKVPEDAWASIGEVSNEEKRLEKSGKAGRNRWRGIRPTVRGVAMNPVDHPQGGGEARSRGRRKRIKTPWGKSAGKGEKTRTPKKYSNKLIVSRRKVGKKR
ncbi:MAG: 50S ribosomal protein L2 [Candidatus Pacebacteria bacterium]|nr:50S ribosomal protein L2 [Candidatus Paceibacterota bacterium]